MENFKEQLSGLLLPKIEAKEALKSEPEKDLCPKYTFEEIQIQALLKAGR